MPYDISWYVPERVLLANFREDVTLSDFKNFNREMLNYLDKSDGAIYVLVNAAPVWTVSARPLDIITTMPYLKHPKLGWGAIIGANKFTRFLASVVLQAAQVRVRFQDDLKSAVDFLQQVDETINWDAALEKV